MPSESVHKSLFHNNYIAILLIAILILISTLLLGMSRQIAMQGVKTQSEASENQLETIVFDESLMTSYETDGTDQPPKICGAIGRASGPDRAFGSKLYCQYNCGDGVWKSKTEGGPWTNESCQLEAETICCYPYMNTCGAKIELERDQPDSQGRFCSNHKSAVGTITCPQTNSPRKIVNYQCTGTDNWLVEARHLCCPRELIKGCYMYQDPETPGIPPIGGKSSCDAFCMEKVGKTCEPRERNPGWWQCCNK